MAIGFLELGSLFNEVRENQLYVLQGYDTFEEWLGEPDIDVSYQVALRFISIYETYILKFNMRPELLAGIEYTKLEMLSAMSDRPKEVIEDWLERAKVLKRSDLRKEIKGELGEEIKESVTLLKCPKCGNEGQYLQFPKRTLYL